MKREYSQLEIEKILKEDAKIPSVVEESMERAYENLGLKPKQQEQVVHFRKKRRSVWKIAAAVAALTAALSLTAVAVNKLMRAQLKEEKGTVVYQIQIDPEQMEAHKISVIPDYMPDGYHLQEENTPYGEKWYNKKTDGVISIESYNAAELYCMIETGDSVFPEYDKKDLIKSTEIQGMKADLFYGDTEYTDNENRPKNVFLFQESQGYAVWISALDTLSDDEILKIAQNLKITVEEETVSYPSEKELAQMKEDNDLRKAQGTSVLTSSTYQIGEIIENKEVQKAIGEKIQYQVEEIRVQDQIDTKEFSEESFISDFESEIKSWLNEDGTLKEHNRYPLKENGTPDQEKAERAQGQFAIVRMKAHNAGENAVDTMLVPLLYTYEKQDGILQQVYRYINASESYQSLSGEMPIYQSLQENTENEKQHVFFKELQPGEEAEYTLIYIIDKDQTHDAYLQFFEGAGLVKVEK